MSRIRIQTQNGQLQAIRQNYPCLNTKIKHVTENTDGANSSVIFSSWTSTLDLADVALAQEGIRCLRFDGKTPNKQRKSTLQEFSDPNGPAVLLMSLQCGAVG